MTKLSQLVRNTDLEEEGQWFTYSGEFDVKLRSRWAPSYQAAIEKASRPHSEVLARGGEKADEALRELTKEAAARGLIVDWRGLEKADGTPDEYTPERALELFNLPGFDEFFEFVALKARTSRLWRVGNEDDLGN